MLVSATNGKTTTTAMVAEILRPRVRVAHNSAGANLVSGVASALLAADGAELGLFEVDEAALPEVARRVRPKAVLLANLFRDQLDRYGELELLAARWREATAALPDAELVLNADDPHVGDLGTGRARVRMFGVDDPRVARAGAAARRRREVLRPLRDALRLRRGVRRATSATTAARRAATRVRRSTSRRGRSSCAGSTAPRSRSRLRRGRRA